MTVPRNARSSTGYMAIDFGTSNSAAALPGKDGSVELVELEPGRPTMPTAVFYTADPDADGADKLFGRAAIAAYVDGVDGRLMRSLKSVLGSALVEQTTDVGRGRAVRHVDVVAGYLRHLRSRAEADAGREFRQVVLGRPVYFVDDDPARDAKAQATLEAAARAAGFDAVQFQFEPIAAALDLERSASREQAVLVADIGGGTSDFAVVRIGPLRRGRAERRSDILSSHGVHVAGTDFDRRVELAAILPWLGYRALGPPRRSEPPREVPSAVYFDLATWHLINTVYAPARVAELRALRSYYGNADHHRRLMCTVGRRLGHALAGAAEQAKIEAAAGDTAHIDLSAVEEGPASELSAASAAAALESDLGRIVDAALETLRRASLSPGALDVVYFTGGSTGLGALVERIGAALAPAGRVLGDRFASVAHGLGVHAALLHGGARAVGA